MYTDEDLLPLSALQHLIFCERQCALIHIEQQWNENLFTAEGRVLHERVHAEHAERRRDMRVEYGMSLRSFRLGVVGKADIVEFHRSSDNIWQPYPVEFKRGRKKPDNRDTVQLCAQAICLEEMLDCEVQKGAIYYGKERRRIEIKFDQVLRNQTQEASSRLHLLIISAKTPPPIYAKKCDTCSLFNLCLPKVVENSISIKRYFKDILKNYEKTS